MHKRILLMLVSLVLLAGSLLPPAAAENVSDGGTGAKGYEAIAENARLLLEADLSNGLFRLTDKTSGYVRYSVPAEAKADKLAVGQNKMELQSQLVVYYRNKKTNIFVVNSMVSCINRKSIQVKKIADGIRVDFHFKEENFVIPVEYVLKDEYLETKILTDQITESSENKITKIDFLPYFLSGTRDENGYMMVPDGSGALIHFNNGKTRAEDYYASVYGADAALDAESETTNHETVRLPVCGIRNSEQAGMLGVIAEGDALTDIGAGISGKKSSYNHAWFSFRYREEESTGLMEMNMDNYREVLSVSNHPATVNFTVRYYPLNSATGGTDYSAMANRYRTYLVGEKQLHNTSSEALFLVDILGGVRVKKSVLGMPMEQMEALTTFAQASSIAEALQQAGIRRFSIRYRGWGKDGMKNIRIPNTVTVQSSLGSVKGLQELNRSLAAAALPLYLDVDPVSFMKKGNGVSAYANSTKNIFNLQSWQGRYDWFMGDSVFKPYLLLTPQMVAPMSRQYIDSFQKLGLENLSISMLGSSLYSDFSAKEGTNRAESLKIWQETLAYAGDKESRLMVDGGNAYALPYADAVVEAPAVYSGYLIEDEEIPFYSMVTHGSVAIAAAPLNLSSRPEYMLLKTVESGMGFSYICAAENTGVLKSSEFNTFFSGEFSGWRDSAAALYARVYPFLNKTHTAKIMEHRQIQPGVYKTTYDSGDFSLVNYNAVPVEAEGKTIGAMDFVTSMEETDTEAGGPSGTTYKAIPLNTGSPWGIWMVAVGAAAVSGVVVAVWIRCKKHRAGYAEKSKDEGGRR